MARQRGAERPADDPLKEELARLAEKYGDLDLLRICLWTVQRYADIGAQRALLKRKGDPAIQCETCRERKVLVEQFERNMKEFSTGRPIGGAPPSEIEEG